MVAQAATSTAVVLVVDEFNYVSISDCMLT